MYQLGKQQTMNSISKTLLIVATLIAYWLGLGNASAFYDPGAQRWLNRDPIQERGGIHPYMFALNHPINEIDADGLSPWSYLKKYFKCNNAMKKWSKKCLDSIPKEPPCTGNATEDAFALAEFYSNHMLAEAKCAKDSQEMFAACMESAYDLPVVEPPISLPGRKDPPIIPPPEPAN